MNNETMMTSERPIRTAAIIEEALDRLGFKVTEISDLTNTIANILCATPAPRVKECGNTSPNIKTIAGSLGEIYEIADEARVRLEDTAKLLNQHFGDLKLEY